MSKIFYDKYIVWEKLEKHITLNCELPEEREDLWKIVDETIHHRALGSILDRLPEEHHFDFLEKFHKSPHSEELIDYLSDRINEDFEEFITKEFANLENELLESIKKSPRVNR